jgi:hypothetical protein
MKPHKPSRQVARLRRLLVGFYLPVLTMPIGAAPVITQHPEHQSASVGSNAMFGVVATGIAPISYQWLFEGVPFVTYTSNNAKTDYNAPLHLRDFWDASGKEAHYRKRPNPQQPFFSVFNHEVTHESCLFPPTDKKLDFEPTAPTKVRLPAYQPDTPELRADWARYYDHLALRDEQIAEKLKALEADGVAENTIVFYYADNGGVLPRAKRFLQASGTHVPLIVYFPPKWRHLAPAPPGIRWKAPVSFVDFAPTALSLAGVDIPKYQARGYESWARMAREGKLTRATSQFWGEKPTEELYDLEADPDNVNNFAADPAHGKTLNRMRAALKQHTLEIVDNGFLPEGSALEGYDAARAPGVFPIERVFELANLASERNPKNLPALINALDDPVEPVRWWAAQGCAMLRAQAAPAETALRRRKEDASGAVQIVPAEALARLGKPELALPILQRWLQNRTNAPFALQAANVLDRIGEEARPALPAMNRVLAGAGVSGDQYVHRLLGHVTAVLEGKTLPLVYPAPK